MHQFLLYLLLLMQHISVFSLGQVSSAECSSGRPTRSRCPHSASRRHSRAQSTRGAGLELSARLLLRSAQRRLLQPHCCAASTALPASCHLGAYKQRSHSHAGGCALSTACSTFILQLLLPHRSFISAFSLYLPLCLNQWFQLGSTGYF